MRHIAPLLAFILLSACGTGVYNHQIEVTINDPSQRLGPPPFEISIFDKNGDTEDWARRTIGAAAPGKPYSGKTWGTDTKMFYDRSPSMFVDGGLFLPALEKRGYFNFQIRPVNGTEQTTTDARRRRHSTAARALSQRSRPPGMDDSPDGGRTADRSEEALIGDQGSGIRKPRPGA